MPVAYCYNPINRTIEVVCSGELVLSEILDYFAAISGDETIATGAVELIDLSLVYFFNVDFQEASRMPQGYRSAHEVKAIKGTILYGANELNEGLAELVRSHFRLSLPQHTFLVVKAKDEAEEAARRLHEGSD